MVRSNFGSTTVVTLTDLLNFSVENTIPNTINVQIQLSVENYKTGQVAQATSNTLSIHPGPTIFTNELYNMLRFTYAGSLEGKNLMNTQVFDEGNYKVCYKINNANDNMLLGDYCTDFSITGKKTNPTQLDTNAKKRPVTIHGTSEVLFNYSTNQTNFTNLPPTYLNWTLSPQITVLDVPVSGRLFLTTQQLPGQQSMNNFTFNFDANQFKNILKTKLLNFIKKNKALSKIGNLDFDSYIKEYDNIKGIFSNPAVLDELKQITELDSLKNMVNNFKEGANNIKNTVNGYKEKYESIQQDYKEIKSVFTGDSLVRDSLKNDSNFLSTDPIQLDSLEGKLNGKLDLIKDSLGTIKDSIFAIKDSVLKLKDKYMGKMDSVQNVVNGYMNDPTQLGYQALDSLKKRIKALEWLESKKVYYDKLMEKKKTIEEYGKKFGLIDSAGNFTSFDKIKDINTDQLSDPAYLYSKLKSNKLLRKFDKILYSVKSLTIGLATPQYSNFSLNGMAVNGFSIEVEPFNVYGSFTYGTVMNPVLSLNAQNASYKRNLYAGKLGYGAKEKSHIHITLLSATDDSSSINPRDSIYLYYKLPQDNKVISIDGQLNLFKDKLILSAELSGSQTIKDLTSYSTNNIINGVIQADPNNWFVNIFTQNHQVSKSVVDYAVSAKIEANLFKNKTKLSASFKRVGPNYYSFGLPFLIRDMMTLEVKVSQSFWKNRLQISGFVRRNEDNLEGTKLQTTQFYNYGFDFNLKVPKWPTLKAGLTPMILQSDTSYFNMIALNINSTYSFRIRKVQNISSLSFIKQMSAANDTNLFFDITYVNFLHSLQLKSGPSININSSYINSTTSLLRKDTWVVGAGTSFTVLKIWNNLLGGNFFINQNETKWGAYWQTNVNIAKHLTFSLRLENNQFNTYLNLPGISNYTQFTCRTSIIARW
jgi:archaellum component FlaC